MRFKRIINSCMLFILLLIYTTAGIFVCVTVERYCREKEIAESSTAGTENTQIIELDTSVSEPEEGTNKVKVVVTLPDNYTVDSNQEIVYVSDNQTINIENSLVQQYLMENTSLSTEDSTAESFAEQAKSCGYRAYRPVALAFNFTPTDGMVILDIVADHQENVVYRTQTDGKDGVVYTTNLIPGETYLYQIMDANRTIIETGQFDIEGTVRMIYVDGVYNVRDLGGKTGLDGRSVKYGMLYRGGELSGTHDIQITDAGILTMHNQLEIGCELDLRAQGEVPAGQGEYSDIGDDVAYNLATIEAYDLDSYKDSYKAALDVIFDEVDAGIPVYFHCYVGCDRTGSIAFLLNGLLGVSEDDLDTDYELSSMYIKRSKDETDYADMLDYIEDMGGDTLQEKFNTYFIEIGFSQSEIDSFIDAMLE